jgi:probable DNA repair protein
MIAFDFAAALAPGTTLVTPNKRLARTLVARHDDAMVRAGHKVWPAMHALPWQSWLETLWFEALAAHALTDPRPILSAHAAAFLWDRIVERDAVLLDPGGAAQRASDAWRTFHAWRTLPETFDAWARSGIADDASAFAGWARRFAEALAERRVIDAAQLPDQLTLAAPAVTAWRNKHCLLAGFFEFTPQQQRLLAALRATGCALTIIDLPVPRAGRCARVACSTPQAELTAALAYARERALADPEARIGIVIANLDERRSEVLLAAEDVLCPDLAGRCAVDAARPYAVSFGTPLAEVPVVACALALIEWMTGSLPVGPAAVALRSPYLPGGEKEWLLRARCEDEWRATGLRAVSFVTATSSLATRGSDPLVARWRAAVPSAASRQPPAAWADAWHGWLTALGWPGDRSLGSGEWQARDAFLRLLGSFAALSPVAPTLPRDEATAALRAAAGRMLFQPEAPPARIQILGMLEASGLDVDALWIAGLSAEHWPPAATPTPLLPIGWQRDHGVPRASADRALTYARMLTDAFAHAADDVTASHAALVDGQERAVSALVATWPEATADAAALGRAVQIEASRPSLDLAADSIAPGLAEGATARGGVDVVESQSTCPFQAFARHRLGARAPSDKGSGLSAMERGILLHRTLAAFWQDVGDQPALLALDGDALRARIERAVLSARDGLGARRWRALPASIARAEPARLAATVHAWIVSVERERPPFTVIATEVPGRLALGGIELEFRVDRVDALATGGLAIIDYKSGRAPAPAKWFAVRPAGTQVGLYALAQRARTPAEPVVAAVYAQLKAGAVAVNGLAADSALWPGLRSLPGAKGVTLVAWSEVEAAWRSGYGALAEDFRAGRAAVAPRDAAACRLCDLQPLCRIQQLVDTDPSSEGESAHDA